MGAYFADSGRDAGHATASIMPFDSGPVIVALGASAGGLEALHGFFGGMPADPRFAFVVVTHLPPQRGSRLAEVLRRATAMPVTEAQDGERVEPAQVYVIPPNRLMGIEDGRLRLEQAVPRPAIPHPIDYFMSALADDRQERSVGIVLSGADHDGTAGLKEIKAAGGLVMVQDPASAQFPGMPTSAISADVPDAVLTVDRMGQALIDYIEHVPEDGVADCAPTASPEVGDAGVAGRLGEILAVVRERSGQDFRGYRSAMLLRRLRRRMGLKAVGDASGYLDLLKTSDDEVQALVKDFRISVTEFFRQPDAWHALEKGALPQLIEERMAARTGIRVWTPGCATGEESYSIAMLLLEQLGERGGDAAVNVFASDVDAAALAVARAGSYPESIVDSIDPLRVVRFFEKQNDRYVVRKQLRESVLFAPHDLVQDPPFSKLDLIVCRNVLIYFEPEQQGRILEMFHFALNPHGILFLGKSESLGLHSDLFEPVSAPFRIFRRVDSAVRVPRPFQGQWSGPRGFLTPAATSPPQAGLPAERVRRHLGDRVPQAAVLVNRDFRALYFHGEAGRFLQPSGEPAWDLLSLLRDGMRGRVRAALQQAITVGGPVDAKVHMKRDRHRVPVNVRVEPLEDFGRSGLLVVCFDERGVAPGGPSQDDPSELSELHEELQRLRGELEFAEQESESTSSELRVANEEAMSLNEELQSSNEELQTSKEELQSTNEELSSVNSELEAKVDELERVLGDLRNLMDNTRVATLFLDRDLHIRRFTREATRLFRVIPSDEGRPLGDIAFRVSDPTLLADAQGVLDDASPRECEVSIAEGEWFLRRVVPYRAAGERIEGVVVTYVDISRLRRAAQDARRLAAVLQDANDAIIVHDFAGRILSWNQGAERAYGYAKKEALGLNIRVLEPAEVAGNALALAAAVRQAACGGPAIARRLTRDGRVLTVSVTTSALRDDAGEPYAVVTTERDVTEKLRQESELRFRALADDIPTLLRIDDFEGRAEFVNRAWLSFTGESHAESLLERGWFRYVHPDDLPGYLEGMRKAREEGRRFEGDLRLRRADGRYRWVRTTAVARTDEASPRPGFVSVAVDIEERKSAEQAIAKESERKDEFLAMLAHELRNPLSPIANAVTVIERRAPADPKVAWAAEVIGRQTRQLTRLVDDLMDVARITSGKVPLAHDLIEMAALVEQGRDSSQPLIESRSQRLEISVPPDTLYVEGDLGRLTQVIANLLNNASKYSNAGDTIALAVSSAGDEVVISVSDHGVGISAEMLPRVFELFAQEQKTLDRAQGGLGIGLTLVDRLVRAHGGRVEAISAGRGCGSEFIVRLPAVRPRPLKADADDTATHPPTSGRRILVVDDNADNATSTAVLLEHAGHAARTAGNGPDALVAAADFRPDVAILDIGLPGMNGYDLARELRARPETAGTLLIALTGYGQAEDRERVKSAGFDHHLVKPASFDQLMEMLK